MIHSFKSWEINKKNLSLKKVRVKIDDALDNLEFNEAINSTLDLSNIIKSSRNLNSISRFNEFNNLNESAQVKQAKEYYLKKLKQKYSETEARVDFKSKELDSENVDQLSEPRKKDLEFSKQWEDRMLSNPELNWVLNLVKTAPNYAITFVKFKFDQGANNDELSNIFRFATDQQTRNFVKDLPLGNIEAYAKIPKREGENPGYMQLIDHIGDIEAAREGFWIIDAFVTRAGIKDTMGNVISGKVGFNQKTAFKQAPQEVKDNIIKLAGDMNRRDNTGSLIRAFTKKMSNYESLDIIIEGLTDMINAIGSKKEEVSLSHHNDYPGCSVIWENSEKILVLYRSPKSLGEMCRHANWCIKPVGYGAGAAGSFYTYAYKGRIQFAMWDFSVPATSDMSLVGFTVSPNGTVTDANNKKDDNVKNIIGNTLEQVLRYYKVPKYYKEQILSSLESESQTMKSIEPIYKQIESGKKIDDIIGKLLKRSEKRAHTFKYQNEIDKASAFTDRLISSEISKSENIDEIRDTVWNLLINEETGGLTNIESARMFNTIFGKSEYCMSNKIDLILNINKDKSMRTSNILDSAKSGDKESYIIAYAIKNNQNIDDIIRKCEILIESISQANIYLESLKK